MKKKLYAIEGKTYLDHINDEVHLYGLLHQLAFLAGRIKDEQDVVHVLDTAKRYGEIAEEKFQGWDIPGRYLVFGDPKDLKNLMDKELALIPAEKPKPVKYLDEYIIPGGGFRLLVGDIHTLIVLYYSLARRLSEAETEKDFLRLKKKAGNYEKALKKVYRSLGLPEDSTGLSGLLNQVVKNIFEVPHTYQVSFSLQAWAVTFLFFALMYGFGMLRAAKIIRHQKVIDLLYDNRKNEEYRFKSFRHSLLVVLLSIAAMVAGVILLGRMLQTQTNEAFLYLGGACLLILVGVYELHRQIPLLLHRFAKQNLRHKYKEENLFFLGQIGRRIHSAGRTMAVVAILLTISLATMFVGLTMGAGYKANMKAYYPYDAGVAIDAPLEKSNMDSIVSFTEEHCGVEDSVSYYLYAVPEKPIEALSLSDYNHLREILGLSPVVMGNNEFLVHCDTWNYMDGIRQGLKQQPEITLNGRTLTIAETPILTEPMEQYQMAGTKGYVLVLPDEAASQLVGEKIRLAMKLEDGGYPELKSDLKQFLNSGKWQPELQSGQQLPEKVTMGVTVKAWGVANSLTGFTAISFCGLYLSIIFIILSCSVLAFEQLSAIDKNQKNYAVIDRLGVPGHRQASLIRRELSTVFLIPLLFPLLLTVLLIAGAQFFFGEAILQQGLVPLYGLVTILLFCAIYLTYFGATMFLFKRVILRPEMR